MNVQDLHYLGNIQKIQGIHNGFIIKLQEEIEEYILESVFIELDGILVPFFLEENSLRDPMHLFVRFTDIETIISPEELLHKKVFISLSDYPGFTSYQKSEDVDVAGYQLYDIKRGKLGNIDQINDYAGNLVMEVKEGKKSWLIPFHEDWVIEINEKEKKITLELPPGIMEIND